MTTSRSTPRLRFTALILVAVVGVVAVSERPSLTGLAGEIAQLLGLALMTCAALGRIWCSTFIAGFKDRVLVDSGPYSALRHPLYALSMVGMLGAGLATRSITLMVLLPAILALTHALAAKSEEQLLRELHGAAYDRYVAETPAFVPRFSKYTVPESLEMRPRVFWKAFLDAGSLIGVYVLIRIADALQAAGVTPTLLHLP
jgi:protein-S-isoprenylcysteine O-methyltransferase Ste14